jgi:serine/threonine protein kinase
MTDEAFNHYLRNPDIIRTTHPISKSAADIIKRIFVVNPLARITLSELREEIIKLDTLFMSEEDIQEGPLALRQAAVNYSGSRCSSSDANYPRIHSPENTVYGILDEEDPEERYLFPSPDPDAPYPYLSPLPPRMISPTHEDQSIDVVLASLFESAAAVSQGSSGSSAADSDGPITPETHAAKPAIEVPELSVGEDLDQSIVFADPYYLASTANFTKKAQTPRLFKNMVQRVKAKVQSA